MPPTCQQKLEAIRLACITVNPSIKDLVFGCKLKIAPRGIGDFLMTDYLGATVISSEEKKVKTIEFKDKIAKSSIIEIIGRDIQLADVLLVIIQRQKEPTQEGYIWNVNKKTLKLLEMWNMLKPCHLQDDPTISFIYELIK